MALWLDESLIELYDHIKAKAKENHAKMKIHEYGDKIKIEDEYGRKYIIAKTQQSYIVKIYRITPYGSMVPFEKGKYTIYEAKRQINII